ncbi:unnamed protein product [Camellia sinensis]
MIISRRDLLSTDTISQRGTVIEKLTEEPLRNWNHVMELLSIYEAQGQIGETVRNEISSRSHQIIRLQGLLKHPYSCCGSESASHSLSAGTRLKEGCHINRSLLTLGTIIRKLRFRKL